MVRFRSQDLGLWDPKKWRWILWDEVPSRLFAVYPPWNSHFRPWKKVGWNTIISLWGPAYVQGLMLNFGRVSSIFFCNTGKKKHSKPSGQTSKGCLQRISCWESRRWFGKHHESVMNDQTNMYTYNPHDPCFTWKRPCFQGLTFTNRGHWVLGICIF